MSGMSDLKVIGKYEGYQFGIVLPGARLRGLLNHRHKPTDKESSNQSVS